MPRKLSSFSRFYLNVHSLSPSPPSPGKGFRNDCNPPRLHLAFLCLRALATAAASHSTCLCLRPVSLSFPSVHVFSILVSPASPEARGAFVSFSVHVNPPKLGVGSAYPTAGWTG